MCRLYDYAAYNAKSYFQTFIHEDIIINHQHGFRQKVSCETQLISAINDWVKSINHRTQTDVILLDFNKAFDSVPHQCLLSKLNCNGIRDRSLD